MDTQVVLSILAGAAIAVVIGVAIIVGKVTNIAQSLEGVRSQVSDLSASKRSTQALTSSSVTISGTAQTNDTGTQALLEQVVAALNKENRNQ